MKDPVVSIIQSKKYFDNHIHRDCDLDSVVVGPTGVNIIIQPSQHGFGRPQHYAAHPAQPHVRGGGGGPDGYLPVPSQIGQTDRQEGQ